MSTPPFRYSKTLSMFPALAARRKLVLLSDYEKKKKEEEIRLNGVNILPHLISSVFVLKVISVELQGNRHDLLTGVKFGL